MQTKEVNNDNNLIPYTNIFFWFINIGVILE